MDQLNLESLISEVAGKLLANSDLMSSFKSDPVSLITKTLGIDLGGDQLTALIEGVTRAIGAEKASGILGALKGILGK
ncbi:MAG: hypothetical protein IJ573_09200 [Clostridia bacterium]|nr:hypothetical protein [Clostridia bacterium]